MSDVADVPADKKLKIVYTKAELKTLRQEMGVIVFPQELLERGKGKIVTTNIAAPESTRRIKKEDPKDKRKVGTMKDKSVSGNRSGNSSSSSSASNPTTEAISPTSWRKTQGDFPQVGSKLSSKKMRDKKEKEQLEYKTEKRNNNNNNENNTQNKNQSENNNMNINVRKNVEKNDSRGGNSSRGNSNTNPSHKQLQEEPADLWDMPTGLSSEESHGLSEREMFELERKKFLAMRHLPIAGASIEGKYHTESDTIMSNMQIEQAELDEVSGSTFDFQLKQPVKSQTEEGGGGSGIRSMTASDLMTGGNGGGGTTSEDMAWFGAMLSGTGNGSSVLGEDKGGNRNSGGGKEQSSDQDFFSHFLSDPFMDSPLSPQATSKSGGPLSSSGGDSSGNGQSVLEASRCGSHNISGSSTKSSRLGSILGIPLTPPFSATEAATTSDIQDLSFSLENMGSTDNIKLGSLGGGGVVKEVKEGHSNQKSRDLMATLGFSPPRNTPSHHFRTPQGPQQVNHNGMDNMNNNIINDMNRMNNMNNCSGARFVFQENAGGTSPHVPPSGHSHSTPSAVSSNINNGKTQCATRSASSPAAVATLTSNKRATMSASSRLQLARMKQHGGGGKKRIEVSSLFTKAPIPSTISSSSTSSITASDTAPGTGNSSAPSSGSAHTPMVNAAPAISSNAPGVRAVTSSVASTTPTAPPISTNTSPPTVTKVTTNSKGASLLMKLKK